MEGGRGRPVRCEGYLFKRGQNAFRTWNRRWFFLSNNKVAIYFTVHFYLYSIMQLCYSKRNGEDETIIEDDLRICLVRPLTDTDRRYHIQLSWLGFLFDCIMQYIHCSGQVLFRDHQSGQVSRPTSRLGTRVSIVYLQRFRVKEDYNCSVAR